MLTRHTLHSRVRKQSSNGWPVYLHFQFLSVKFKRCMYTPKNNFEYKIHQIAKNEDGIFLALDISIEKKKITFITLYGPNNDNPVFFEKINKTINDFQNVECIICGDFNLVLDPNKDYFNYLNINNSRARSKMLSIINEHNLKDCFRILHPNVRRYTWRRRNPIKQARLDFFSNIRKYSTMR